MFLFFFRFTKERRSRYASFYFLNSIQNPRVNKNDAMTYVKYIQKEKQTITGFEGS